MDFIDYCDQHKILLAIFPSHSMHMLQPLDVCMFKPLSQAYSDELSAFLKRSQRLSPIKKGDFFPLSWKAWVSSCKKNTIINSFKRFVGTDPDEQGSRERSASVLSFSAQRV
jgi:hypothetical protein